METCDNNVAVQSSTVDIQSRMVSGILDSEHQSDTNNIEDQLKSTHQEHVDTSQSM